MPSFYTFHRQHKQYYNDLEHYVVMGRLFYKSKNDALDIALYGTYFKIKYDKNFILDTSFQEPPNRLSLQGIVKSKMLVKIWRF